MRAEVGYSNVPDSAAAGKQAAAQAISMSGRAEPCDLVLLFCTIRHNQRVLRKAVSETVGASVPIYGGGAVGVITNEDYGYAGDQVGVACLWLDGVTCEAFTDSGLADGEVDTGFRLGQSLAGLNVTPDSPVMLFYDSIGPVSEKGLRLMMATWLLEGLQKALGFQANIAGAGLMADHACSPTSQYTGNGMLERSATALAFGGNIRMDTVVMRGCQPASVYYTVTKAEGPTILEINHTPAIDFIDGLVGPDVKPEQYPFFLLFGINSGEPWGEFDEEKYASRLCFGIDPERNGIVMFEPDMVEGTEFQLMFRSYDLDYMKPKFEAAFHNLNDRKPVFALYINCIGRCAGYGGVDIEDALALQQAVAGRVPVLGLYTGVEIAKVSGRPRGLDLTGVFCLFSQGEGISDAPALPEPELTACLPPSLKSDISLRFVNRLCEQNVARVLTLEKNIIALRYELELKRRGFSLLSELAVSLRQTNDYNQLFVQVAQRINAALNMQKTVVLLSDSSGKFVPAVLQGFTPDDETRLKEISIRIPDELLISCPAVVTGGNAEECFEMLRTQYALPFFIVSPIYLQDEAVALMLTGRSIEQEPYLTRLGVGDMETVCAITELLGSVLVRLHLQGVTAEASTDGLTGLRNRNAFQRTVQSYLNGDKQYGAFMMIDVDNFKTINDTYGHIAGDEVLKACSGAVLNILRDSDIVGRQGGDEFVVFCQGIRNATDAGKKAIQLADAWRSVIPAADAKHVTASIGIALSPQHGTTFKELYKNADAALYKSKERGKDCYTVFE